MTDIWKVDQFDNGPKFTTGPQATVTAMVAEFVTKQHPDSTMPGQFSQILDFSTGMNQFEKN